MASRVKPIPLRLNPAIEFEAALREQYDAKPRARRQEFLRQMLRLGWEVMQQMQQGLSPAASMATLVPRAAAEAVPAPAPVAPAVSARPVQRPAELAATSTGESAKALKGFFDEAPQQ